MTRIVKFIARHKIIAVSMILGFALSFIRPILVYSISLESSFWDFLVTDVPDYEIYARYIIFFGFILFGFIISKVKRQYVQAKRTLQENEEPHKKFLTAIFDCVIIHENGKILYANPALESMTGYKLSDAIGRSLLDFVTDEYRSQAEEMMKKDYDQPFEIAVHRKDGTVIWAEAIGRADTYKGRSIRVVAVRDISDRKRAEIALRNQKEQAQNYLDIAGVMIIVLNSEGNITTINKRACEIFGYSEKELIGANWFAICLPENIRAQVLNVFKQLMAGQIEPIEHYENSVITKSGEERLIAWNNSILRNESGQVIGTLSSGEDVTERKQSEQALRESEERFGAMSASAQDAIIMMDPDGDVSYWNDMAREMFGWSSEEIIGRNLHEVLAPEHYLSDHKKGFDKFQQSGEGAAVGQIIELTACKKDGSVFPVELSLASVKLKGRWNAIAIVRDITKRKQAEEELEHFKIAVESSSDAVGMSTPEGKHLYQNKAFDGMFGDIRDNPPESVYVDEKVGKEVFQTIMEGDKWIDEVEMYGKRKKTLNIFLRAYPIKNEEGKIIGLVGMHTDITETKRLQELESRAQRLETAGKIAGQVAHDFNNLLGPMIAYPDFLDHTAIQMLKDIEKAATAMADINQQLLTLSRRGHFEQKTINLNNVVNECLGQLVSLPDTLHIETDMDKKLMNIKGGPSQIVRIISNLVINASDAMQNNGYLFIKTEN